jgi:hypothetical protein
MKITRSQKQWKILIYDQQTSGLTVMSIKYGECLKRFIVIS